MVIQIKIQESNVEYLCLPEIHLKKNGDSVSGIMGWNISACIFYL